MVDEFQLAVVFLGDGCFYYNRTQLEQLADILGESWYKLLNEVVEATYVNSSFFFNATD